jgi:hypothetical protein
MRQTIKYLPSYITFLTPILFDTKHAIIHDLIHFYSTLELQHHKKYWSPLKTFLESKDASLHHQTIPPKNYYITTLSYWKNIHINCRTL